VLKPKVVFGRPILPNPDRVAQLYTESVATGWLTNSGPLHSRLECALASWFGDTKAYLLSSGTMALMMALRAGGLREGSEIITTPLSFTATAQAIAWCGFKPVFADICPETMTLDPRAVEAAITPRTAAVMPVHFLGQSCDVVAFGDLALRHRLWLAYDAAHAFGATVNGRAIASYGDASAFSLHATKLMHTGEGGMLAINGDAAANVAQMRNFGLQNAFPSTFGINGKLSESGAAVGLAVLEALEAEIVARRRLRDLYCHLLDGIEGVTVMTAREGTSDSLIYFVLRLPAKLRSLCLLSLVEAGILARDHFPLLCGRGTAFPDSSIVTAGENCYAPLVAPEVICLPFHSAVCDESARTIADTIKQVMRRSP